MRHLKMSLIIVFTFFICFSLYSQPSPPGDHGSEGNEQPAGGAPIGEGAVLLSILALGYGLRRWKSQYKEINSMI